MSDRWAIVLALAAAAGARLAAPLPIALAVVLTATALAAAGRAPLLLCLAAACATSALGARALDGLVLPPTERAVVATATLVTDPAPTPFGALRAVVRLPGGRRAVVDARGAPASTLVPALAGERFAVRGRLEPLDGRAAAPMRARHVGARLQLSSIHRVDGGTPVVRAANAVRRTLVRGAESLGPERRALFTGLVVGDDRHQSPATTADFRAAGLSHLSAVSGQNVAFVLALAAPALRRLRLSARTMAAIAVIAFFVVVTRAEPSVVRAGAMAAIALGAHAMGRPTPTVRILAVAVTALLVVDPLLIRSLGFLLSCGASAGIACLAGPLAGRLPGPPWMATALAVPLAAQVGVAPVLLPTFDAIPLVTLPANMAAVPAAGPVMMWGLVAGLPAGLLPPELARLVHLPSGVGVDWIAGVAQWSAAAPLGLLRWPHVLAAGAAGVLWWVAQRPRRLAALVALLVLAAPPVEAYASSRRTLHGVSLPGGGQLWRCGGRTAIVVTKPSAPALAPALRQAGVRHVGIAVATRGSLHEGRALADLHARIPLRTVLAPPGHRVGLGTTAPAGATARDGPLTVTVVNATPPMRVRIGGCGRMPP